LAISIVLCQRRKAAVRTSFLLPVFFALFALVLPPAMAKKSVSRGHPSLAGRYRCNSVRGTLVIVQRTDKEIEFDLDAMWIGDVIMGNVNTGKAHGVVEIEDNKAIYKDSEGPYTLTFTFKRNIVDVQYDGTGFGQWNVTPAGRYKKVSKSKQSL
jgi:hypothetical protein